MKKVTSTLLCAALLLSFAACSGVSAEEHQAALATVSQLESQVAEFQSQVKDFESAADQVAAENSTLFAENEKLKSEISKLTEETLTPLRKEEAAPVIEAISALGEITVEKEEAVNAAQKLYDGLSAESRAFVTNGADLQAAKTKIGELKAAAVVAAAEANAAKSLEDKKQDFISKCADYDYKELARDPAPYVDKPAKFKGKVVQVLESGYGITEYRINVTQGSYSWEDTMYVTYIPGENEKRILEDDIVMIYGNMKELQSYTTVMGATVTIPSLYAQYIDLAE